MSFNFTEFEFLQQLNAASLRRKTEDAEQLLARGSEEPEEVKSEDEFNSELDAGLSSTS